MGNPMLKLKFLLCVLALALVNGQNPDDVIPEDSMLEVASQAGAICGRMNKKATFKKCGRCLTMCKRTSGSRKHSYCQRFTDYCQSVYCRPLKKHACNKSDVCKFDKDTDKCLHNS